MTLTPNQLRQMREGIKAKDRQEKEQMAQQMGLDDGSGDPAQEIMYQQQMQQQQQQMMMQEMAYNPMLAGGSQPDIRRVDRWLQYNVPNPEDADKFWVTETGLAEELAKANLTKEEYNWFVREYTEIEAIAGGDGNEKWVRSRQRKFMMKLNMTRSRSDNPERGLRDGTLLMTSNVNQKSDVRMPSENKGAENNGGFFSFLRGR